MRSTFWWLILSALFLSGCDGPLEDGGTVNITITEEDDDAGTDPVDPPVDPIDPDDPPVIIVEPPTAEEELLGRLDGATFVSVDPLNADGTAVNTMPTANRTLSFTRDTVTSNQIDGTEVGSFSLVEGFDWIAEFDSGSVSFSSNGLFVIWDSIRYELVATSLVDSQESLVSFLAGSTFNTPGQFDIGENALGEVALGPWTVIFSDDTDASVSWFFQDVALSGSYSFIDDSSFTIDFSGDERTVFVLDDGELVIDSRVYETEPLFDSQESLVAFLDGATFQSNELLPGGESASGELLFAHWIIDFSGNTYTWVTTDTVVPGTFTYVGENVFTALIGGADVLIEVDGDEIIWRGERYTRQ